MDIRYKPEQLPKYYDGYTELGLSDDGFVKWIAYGNPGDRFTQSDVFEYHEEIARTAASFKGKPNEFRQWQREMCLKDIYYLGYYVLDIKVLYIDDDGPIPIMRPWLFNRCMEVQSDPDFHVDIWAREHFKSTIITLLKTIQDILNDPEIAVCIYSYNSTLARNFVKQIRENLENPGDIRAGSWHGNRHCPRADCHRRK